MFPNVSFAWLKSGSATKNWDKISSYSKVNKVNGFNKTFLCDCVTCRFLFNFTLKKIHCLKYEKVQWKKPFNSFLIAKWIDLRECNFRLFIIVFSAYWFTNGLSQREGRGGLEWDEWSDWVGFDMVTISYDPGLKKRFLPFISVRIFYYYYFLPSHNNWNCVTRLRSQKVLSSPTKRSVKWNWIDCSRSTLFRFVVCVTQPLWWLLSLVTDSSPKWKMNTYFCYPKKKVMFCVLCLGCTIA